MHDCLPYIHLRTRFATSDKTRVRRVAFNFCDRNIKRLFCGTRTNEMPFIRMCAAGQFVHFRMDCLLGPSIGKRRSDTISHQLRVCMVRCGVFGVVEAIERLNWHSVVWRTEQQIQQQQRMQFAYFPSWRDTTTTCWIVINILALRLRFFFSTNSLSLFIFFLFPLDQTSTIVGNT